MVLDSNPASDMQIGLPLGQKLTVTSAPGKPVLTVVGLATSVTNTASGWVTPGEVARLRAPGAVPGAQMLYRFRSNGTAADIRAGTAAVSRALPPGSVLATESYLTVKASETSRIGPFVPFLVAFGVIGLVMSVLIVANVVSGAVVAGYRRIGILKSIGFTPGQVVAAYTGQVTVAAVVGVLGRLVLGDVLALHAAAPGGQRLRGRHAERAGLGGRGRAGRHAGPGRAGRAAARRCGPAGSARCRPSRPGRAPRHGPRLRRAPAVRPAAAAPAGDDRAGRAVRPPGADRDHPGRGAARARPR